MFDYFCILFGSPVPCQQLHVDTSNALSKSVEYGIILQFLVPAFLMDFAAKTLDTNREIKAQTLIDLNFFLF